MIFAAMLMLMGPEAARDPLAPAREGKLQCYAPDVVAKTCGAIAGYVAQADGSYRNPVQLVVDPGWGIFLEVVSIVRVKGAAVCGPLLRSDLMAGRLSMNGVAILGDERTAILEHVAENYAAMGMLETEVCTTYTPDGDHLRADITIDGVARPDDALPVIWIRPDEGYVVKGRSAS